MKRNLSLPSLRNKTHTLNHLLTDANEKTYLFDRLLLIDQFFSIIVNDFSYFDVYTSTRAQLLGKLKEISNQSAYGKYLYDKYFEQISTMKRITNVATTNSIQELNSIKLQCYTTSKKVDDEKLKHYIEKHIYHLNSKEIDNIDFREEIKENDNINYILRHQDKFTMYGRI